MNSISLESGDNIVLNPTKPDADDVIQKIYGNLEFGIHFESKNRV